MTKKSWPFDQWVENKKWFEIFLDERTERGFCTMFLIGQVTLFKTTNADSSIKRPTFLVINSQLFTINSYIEIYIK